MAQKTIGDHHAYPGRVQMGEAVFGQIEITFGESGAVASTVGDPGWSATKPSGTGVYQVQLPKCSKMLPIAALLVQASGAGPRMVQVTDYDASAGTIDLVHLAEVSDTTAAANATSGDKLVVVALMRRFKLD